MELGSKNRILQVQRLILDAPYLYTKRNLAARFGVSADTISNDIRELRNAGYIIEQDDRWRYAFAQEKGYQQLKELLHFTEEEQALLHNIIDQVGVHNSRTRNLKKKLASLYDFNRLGLSYLRKPYLSKIDRLLEAKRQKQVIILKDYRSSHGNESRDRHVEGFHLSPPDDLLLAYDIEKMDIRHYKISRMGRVVMSDNIWANENRHNIISVDPFYIMSDERQMIHVRLRLAAYNELIERFPLTKAHIQEDENDVYDFQCSVNSEFLGIGNFLLGYFPHIVSIESPQSLKDHLRHRAKAVLTSIDDKSGN